MEGFEPSTFALQKRCATIAPHPRSTLCALMCVVSRESGGNRTRESTARRNVAVALPSCAIQPIDLRGREGIRTHNLLYAIQMHSQLCYKPNVWGRATPNGSPCKPNNRRLVNRSSRRRHERGLSRLPCRISCVRLEGFEPPSVLM